MRHVIGVSVGSQNTVVGVLKNSTVDIILSETSNRCVPTLVAYNERERSFGDAAFSTIKSNFLRTISYPNRYLGLKGDSPFFEEEAKYATAIPKVDGNGKVLFEIDYKNETQTVYPEAAMALFFDKLKQNWMKAGYDTRDIVVSVPDYYTVAERKAMIEAINIADLNCTALVNESSAVALAYGFFKRAQFEAEKPRIVGFIDMGQSKTTISYVSFTKTNQKVLSVTSERCCGAREFDMNLAKFFSDIFYKKHGSEPIKSNKIRLRMSDAISKTRKILTVNKEANLSIESLMDDEDLSHHLSRDEFEKIIAPTLEKFRNILKKSIANLLHDAKLNVSDLHSVEMVGDAVRTPCVQQAVKEIFGLEIGKSLMPDECMARGSTLFAAMNSPYFTFKDFNVEHFNYYSVFIEYPFLKEGNLEIRKNKLISRGENIPNKKSIKFTEKQMPKQDVVSLKFFYNTEEYSFNQNPLLNSFMISVPHVKEEQYQFVVHFLLDICCIPHVDKATVNETYYEDVPLKQPAAPANNTTQNADASKNANVENKDAKAPENSQTEAPKTEKVKKERSNVCMLKVSECNYGNNQTLLDTMIHKEANQENEDKQFRIAVNRRNEIENIIYSTRIKMNDELATYISNEEKNALPPLMDEVENWLYSGDELVYNKTVLEAKSGKMNEATNIIYKRYNEWNGLENVLQYVSEGNANCVNKINQICSSTIKNFIKEDEVFNLVSNANQQLNELNAQISKTPRFMSPPTTAEKLKKQYDDLYQKIQKIIVDAENKYKEEEKRLANEAKANANANSNAGSEQAKPKQDDKMDVE